jgi:hypothetical protein
VNNGSSLFGGSRWAPVALMAAYLPSSLLPLDQDVLCSRRSAAGGGSHTGAGPGPVPTTSWLVLARHRLRPRNGITLSQHTIVIKGPNSLIRFLLCRLLPTSTISARTQRLHICRVRVQTSNHSSILNCAPCHRCQKRSERRFPKSKHTCTSALTYVRLQMFSESISLSLQMGTTAQTTKIQHRKARPRRRRSKRQAAGS